MDYQGHVKGILMELGMYKMYKGCEYIISCINYIRQNENDFLPVTKILYVDVAKEHNTSGRCVERDMRNVISVIWQKETNKTLLGKIFGEYHITNRPTNVEFLMLLYNYIKYDMDKDGVVICPLSGIKCTNCKKAQ